MRRLGPRGWLHVFGLGWAAVGFLRLALVEVTPPSEQELQALRAIAALLLSLLIFRIAADW